MTSYIFAYYLQYIPHSLHLLLGIWPSPLISTAHCLLSLISAYHLLLLFITTYHRISLLITTYHHLSLYAYHHLSLLIHTITTYSLIPAYSFSLFCPNSSHPSETVATTRPWWLEWRRNMKQNWRKSNNTWRGKRIGMVISTGNT